MLQETNLESRTEISTSLKCYQHAKSESSIKNCLEYVID